MSGTHNKGKRRKVWVRLICHICSVEYEVEPWRGSRSKTCSFLCAQKYAARFAAPIQVAKRGTGTKHRYVKEGGRHQHRVVAEKKLGRPLSHGEVVHHIDNNGHNNHPDNLLITTQSEHMKAYHPDSIQRATKARHHL